MKTFKEEFPSLKTVWRPCGSFDEEVCFLNDIKKSCLDKQRVKDAIEKSFNETTFPTVFMEDDFKERILKELGL